MGRVTDRRAQQYWDPDHLVAQELTRIAKDKPSLRGPDCCISNGFHWDEAVLYPPQSHWKEAPAPAFWDGPVARIVSSLEKALAEQ